MKNSIKLFGFTFLFLLFSFTYSQNLQQNANDCKFKGDIEGTYAGKCKKGLAHGKGVFTYSDGMYIYEGSFKNGMMHGKGKVLIVKNNETKVLKRGIWKKNLYVGEKKVQPYKMRNVQSVEKHTAKKRFEGNKIYFNFSQNGNTNKVDNVVLIADSGNQITSSNFYGFENVVFPFGCRGSYTTYNKMRTAKYTARFEIIINESGVWDITLYN